MIHYIKYRVWDWLLCSCVSMGLIFHIYSGFLLNDGIYSNVPAVAVLTAVLTAACILLSFNRTTTAAGIAGGIGLLAFFLVYIRSHNLLKQESENSLFLTMTILILISILVYLACRTRSGIVILFVIGNLITAGSCFLQYPIRLWCLFLFDFALFLSFLYRNYSTVLVRVHTGKIHMKTWMLQTICLCLAAAFLAGGVYMGIIRPLNPPTRELKLITRLKNMELLQVVGISEVKDYLDPNLLSELPPDGNSDSSDTDSGENSRNNAEGNSESQKEEQDKGRISPDQLAQAIHYSLSKQTIPWILIAAAVIIASAFILRLLLIRHWKKQVDHLSPEERIINYYQFFLSRLARCGFKKPAHYTLTEYAVSMDHELAEFSQANPELENIRFSGLTHIYSDVFYGGQPADENAAQLFEQYYNVFYKNLRREMGIPRYLLHIFRI